MILKFEKFSIIFLGLLLLGAIAITSVLLDERVLYISAALVLAVDMLIISKHRFSILLYSCFLIFLLSQFQLPLFDLGRWLFLLIICVASIWLMGTLKFSITPVATGLAWVSCYSILTSFISYYPSISLLKGISLLLFAVFLASVIAAVRALTSDMGVKNYFLRMCLVFAVVSVVSNAIFFLFRPSQSILAERFRGWFVNPNGIGAVYGVFFLPVLAFQFGRHRQNLARFGLLAVLILACIEWLASQSRAGILAGITSLGIFLLGRTKLPGRIFLILVLAMVLSAIIVSNPSSNVLLRFTYRNEETLLGSGRLPVWIATWNRFLEHPLYGSGLGVSDTGLLPVGLAFNTGGYSIEKGNSYLGILEELGIVGTLIFLVTLLMPLLGQSWKLFNMSSSFEEETNQVLIAIVAAGLVNAMFEAWILSVGSVLCFAYWLLAASLFPCDKS